MDVLLTKNNSIVIGEGREPSSYEIHANQIDTEQRVLAWVYHLCEKEGIDKSNIKSFIDCCVAIHPALDIFDKGV